jgi:hypothetical protein
MNYSNEVLIRVPLEKVIRLFDSEENIFKWQPELLSFEHLSGVKGAEGSRSKLVYKMGSREVEMVETIMVKDLPREFSATYEARGVWNEVKNYFEKVDEQTTRWHSECEFKFKGFMKLIAFFMPGSFKKQSQKYMDQFKSFAEGSK